MAVATQVRTAAPAPMLTSQTRAEFLKLIRVPAFSVTSIVLPSMFYAFIGLGQAQEPISPQLPVKVGAAFLASMAMYGVANVMVLGFGISLANERGQKQDLLMQSTPLPAAVYFTAKALAALAIAFISLVVLCVFAAVSGGAHLETSQWLTLCYRAMLCAIPFIGLGFALGYFSSPNAAPAVANLVYLPAAFASGLFLPIEQLPKVLQDLAPYLPLYRGAHLVWNSVGIPENDLATDWFYMGAYTIVFFALALWAYQRDQGRKFN